MKWLTKNQRSVALLALLMTATFIFQSCGVKGRPLPPLKSAPLSDPNNKKDDDKKR